MSLNPFAPALTPEQQEERMKSAFSAVNSTKARAYLVVDKAGHFYDPAGKPLWASNPIREERAYFQKRLHGNMAVYGRKLWVAAGSKVGQNHIDVILTKEPNTFLDTDPSCLNRKPHEPEPVLAAFALQDAIDAYFQNANVNLWLMGGVEAFDTNIPLIGEVHLFQYIDAEFGGSGRPAILDYLDGERFHEVVSKELVVSRNAPRVMQSVWSIFKPPTPKS